MSLVSGFLEKDLAGWREENETLSDLKAKLAKFKCEVRKLKNFLLSLVNVK